MLLKYGASVNFVDAEKNSPLHLAAKSGNVQIMTMLLSSQNLKCLNDKNNEGLTALMIATHSEFLEIVQLLVRGRNFS
jgi:ankyrin repeat protein